MYVYLLSKQNLDLSKEEVLSLSKTNNHELFENCLLLDELVDYKRLAYTKKIYELLFDSSKNFFIKTLKSFDFNPYYKTSFKLGTINDKGYKLSDLADIIWDNIKNPKVDMKNPTTTFEIIFLKNKVLCCKLIDFQNEDFESRRAHLRPFNHPTSLHPRLARCLVNLADSKEIIDPFCGSGGILLEAGLINLKVTGYDIDEIMLKRTKKNLDFYKVKNYELELKNALSINKKFEAIVTDLPYGKNSKLDDIKTYETFIKKAFDLTDKLVIALPDFVKTDFLKKTDWVVKKSFTYYLHKSLSKKIFLLSKKA